MLSKIKSLTLADWIFIALFDAVVFYCGMQYGKTLPSRGSVPVD